MNGAESLVHTLLKSGVDTCFANPGTSEMHFVAALDRIPGMRCVLGLFEGVVTGAADGYGRMLNRPAATLLHCGPGLANAMACLHNARRAQTSIVNVVGDQATYHRPLDPPLTAETETWARGVSNWVRTATTSGGVGADGAAAVQAALSAPGQIATLIAPSDTCWNDGGMVAERLPVAPPRKVDRNVVREIAKVLRSGEPALLLLGGMALRAQPMAHAAAITNATNARLLAQQYNARVERGQGRFPITRIPYVIEQALPLTAGIKHLILVGAKKPVAFFAYPNKPGYLYPEEAQVHTLAAMDEDLADALAQLADELGAKPIEIPNAKRPEVVDGPVTSENIGRALAALVPEGAIISDESATFGRTFFPVASSARPVDWLQTTIGGAIGQGLPVATGAAIACPDRRVIGLQADGSAMYTVQSLWTQAREKLDITTVILSNRKYQILIGEYAAVGANPGRTALDMLDLGNPDLNWVGIANGMGMEGARAETTGEFAELFEIANTQRGPFLIELVI